MINEPKRTSVILLAFIAFLIVMAIWPQAHASGDRITQSNDNNTQTSGDVITGDTIMGGDSSKAYGFSHGLGDVDINQCLASTQFGTIVFSKQKVVLNKWCAAEVYDAKGMAHMAAIMRCAIPEIAEHFDDPSLCVDMNTARAPVPAMAMVIQPEDDDEHKAEFNALQARLDAIEAERLAEVRKAEKAAQRANAAAQRAETRIVQQTMEQKPFLTEEQAQSLRFTK